MKRANWTVNCAWLIYGLSLCVKCAWPRAQNVIYTDWLTDWLIDWFVWPFFTAAAISRSPSPFPIIQGHLVYHIAADPSHVFLYINSDFIHVSAQAKRTLVYITGQLFTHYNWSWRLNCLKTEILCSNRQQFKTWIMHSTWDFDSVLKVWMDGHGRRPRTIFWGGTPSSHL